MIGRATADEEEFGDLGIGEALTEQPQHFSLALGEAVKRGQAPRVVLVMQPCLILRWRHGQFTFLTWAGT
jgi:hypothetical protein